MTPVDWAIKYWWAPAAAVIVGEVIRVILIKKSSKEVKE